LFRLFWLDPLIPAISEYGPMQLRVMRLVSDSATGTVREGKTPSRFAHHEYYDSYFFNSNAAHFFATATFFRVT
jgi:hypothetical protein